LLVACASEGMLETVGLLLVCVRVRVRVCVRCGVGANNCV